MQMLIVMIRQIIMTPQHEVMMIKMYSGISLRDFGLVWFSDRYKRVKHTYQSTSTPLDTSHWLKTQLYFLYNKYTLFEKRNPVNEIM